MSQNSNNNLIVGIDFSMNSIGITIHNGDSYRFISILNRYEITKSKVFVLEKYDTMVTKSLDAMDMFVLFDRRPNSKNKKVKNKNEELNRWHKENMKSSIDLSDVVLETLETLGCDNNTIFVLENYITRNGGDSTIQIIEFTKTMKNSIYRKYGNNIVIVTAPEVKMVAGKGNFNKSQMMISFISHSDTSKLRNFCHTNKSKLIKNTKGDVIKPIDDVVDSYFLVKWYLKHKTQNNDDSLF